MKFGNIEYLYLLWILPAMILAAVYAFRKKDQLLRMFADRELWDRLMPEVHRRRQVTKLLLLLAGVSLLLTALLSPRWGFHWQEIHRRGVDILVAVDVSESMLAEDIKPNRLERAKREITDLVNMLEGDRIGLIAFAGSAFLECPLTLDHGAFKMFLDYLDTDLIPVPGTDVGKAIQTAIKSFVPGRRASKALILITDGEDHPKEAERMAEDAKKKGIRIFPVGIGSEQGAPIPVQDGSGGFKKDRNGQVVLTKLDETSLQKIALLTGGNYVRSVTGDMDLKKIYEEVREKMEAGELQSTKRRRWEERFQWFLFGSLLLVTLEALLPERKRLSKRNAGHAGRILPTTRMFTFLPALCTILALSAGPVAAESAYEKIRQGEEAYGEERYDEALKEFLDAQVENPEDPLLQYNIGEAHYRMNSFTEAEAAFQSAANSGDPVLEEKSFYNLGNCAYRQGKLEEAVAYYQKALELTPEDEDARFNLEFVREEIKRRINESKEREEQQQQQQQQNQSCPNPQQQAGSDSSQEKQQQEQQSSPKEEQGGEKEKQQGAEKEENQASQRPQQQAGQQQEREGDQQPRQAQGTQKTEEQEASQAAAGQQQREGTGARMTPEEAERWLNTLDEEQKELAKKQIQKALGQGRYRPGKDW